MRKARLDWCVVLVATAAALSCVTAHGHKVGCFAACEGRTVSGYAWLGGGGRPKNVPVRVLSTGGSVFLETRTNDAGEFTFEAPCRAELVIVIDAGAGHAARFVVPAKDLPADLPTQKDPAGAGSGVALNASEPEVPPVDCEENPADEATVTDDVARVVAQQIIPLRREIQALSDRQRLQDVLGGIGYLVGIAGLAFYFLGVRRLDERSAGEAGKRTQPVPGREGTAPLSDSADGEV